MGSDTYIYLSDTFHRFAVALYTTLGSFTGVGVSLATLMFIIIGYNLFQGNFKDNSKKFIYILISIPFTTWAVFGSDGYFITDVLIPTFVHVPFKLAIGVMTVSSGDTNGMNGIDAAFGALFHAINHLGKAAEGLGIWHNVKTYIAIFILASVYGFVYLTFFVTQILSMGTLYLFIAIGPPFIYLLSFPQTRGWGMAWVRECIKYAMMSPLAGAVMGITINAINGSLYELEEKVLADTDNLDVFGASFGTALFMSALTVILLRNVPEWAASLTMGIQSDQQAYGGNNAIRNMSRQVNLLNQVLRKGK